MMKRLPWGTVVLVSAMVLVGCGQETHSAGQNPSPKAPPRATSTAPSSSTTAPSTTSRPTPVSTSSSPSPSYVAYHNRIWGYSLRVPQGFTASASPEDGDGKSWDYGKATIEVYGQYSHATGHPATVTSVLRALVSQKHPSYQAHGVDWLVVSGTHDAQIYYIKEFIGATNENVLSIAYPAADQREWNSLVTTVSHSFTPGGLTNSAPASSPFQTERVTIPPSITVQLEVPSGWKKQRWSAGDAAGFVWVNPLNSTEWVRMLLSGSAGSLLNNQGHYDVTQFVNNPGVQWRVVQANQLSGQFTIPIGEISTPIGNIKLNKYVVYGYAEVMTRPSPLGVEIDAVAPKSVATVIATSVIIR